MTPHRRMYCAHYQLAHNTVRSNNYHFTCIRMMVTPMPKLKPTQKQKQNRSFVDIRREDIILFSHFFLSVSHRNSFWLSTFLACQRALEILFSKTELHGTCEGENKKDRDCTRLRRLYMRFLVTISYFLTVKPMNERTERTTKYHCGMLLLSTSLFFFFVSSFNISISCREY